ncbi:MAG: prolyl oligopeptidase family serine peptidase [Pseudomonadales bacterium]|nr:prolyl oligopeptidase family serine peptidase [Pseudomonadales bacterium]
MLRADHAPLGEDMVRLIAATLLFVYSLTSAADTSITKDVIYGHKDGMALTYDVFGPENANGAGVVFMVSGGWFSIWQPAENRLPFFSRLLDAGFTVFAVHHGSAPRFKVPDAVSDVRAAVRHIKENAANHGVAQDQLGVYGGSAGGHLSLMLGLNAEGQPAGPTGSNPRARAAAPQYLSASDADASLAAVVAYFPPVDLRPVAGPNDRFPALDFDKDLAAAISPILYVDRSDPPTKLIHGDADELVPLSNSTSIKTELDNAGVVNDLLVIKGGGHGFTGADNETAGTAMVAWFQDHLLR